MSDIIGKSFTANLYDTVGRLGGAIHLSDAPCLGADGWLMFGSVTITGRSELPFLET